ncbi:hypothetical protein ACGFZQ_18605 [Streptomyces sp. NPDC048254]|uniref:hypothetical protein n=1 Tax=Streptomyces sp. NPDC048254 TaxID=3365525 RepID=UPI003711FC82
MLALRLTRAAHPAVHLRRLLVATAAAGTGFLLLSALGYAMVHPTHSTAALLRLSWCAIPLAATVYLAIAVARTDPGTKPRPGLSALGLGPARLMAIAALNTALACTLGSLLALLVFLHLRGDLTGMPFDGAAKDFLAANRSLPVPAALTLLAVLPVLASTAVAVTLRPRDLPGPAGRARVYGRFGAYDTKAGRETFGAYGRFGARLFTSPSRPTTPSRPTSPPTAGHAAETAQAAAAHTPSGEGTPQAPASETPLPAPADVPELIAVTKSPTGLPWGIAVLAAGLAVESYAGATEATPETTLPGGLAVGPVGVLAGWALTALGLILAAPGLTHLCGRLLQTARPGALRLLAGRVLMAEATRIGRPLGVVCAVASAAFAALTLYDDGGALAFGPLTTLGGAVVAGCTLATLLTAAVEARQSRAGTTQALLRLGAPATVLRSAAALRSGALLALFVPLTLLVAGLAALPLAR